MDPFGLSDVTFGRGYVQILPPPQNRPCLVLKKGVTAFFLLLLRYVSNGGMIYPIAYLLFFAESNENFCQDIKRWDRVQREVDSCFYRINFGKVTNSILSQNSNPAGRFRFRIDNSCATSPQKYVGPSSTAYGYLNKQTICFKSLGF